MNPEAPLLEQLKTFARERRITLPVYSDVARRLHEAARSERYNIEEIVHAIDSDPALAAEVLRAANSAFFGGLVEISTIRSAITRLGLRQVSNLAFMATEKNRYTARQAQIARMMTALWQHASACALATEWIAKRLGFAQLADEVFLGGLLHDIGKLFLLRVLDDLLSENRRASACPPDLVHEVLRQVHADVGYELLREWNLPGIYLTIARDHHAEPVDPANVPLLIVRLANQACRRVGLHLHPDPTIVLPATPEASALGLGEVALAELEIILEDVTARVAA
jgi:putative nucleotidyltransferase with HDIG domain